MSDDKIQSQIAWHEKEIARLQRLLPAAVPVAGNWSIVGSSCTTPVRFTLIPAAINRP